MNYEEISEANILGYYHLADLEPLFVLPAHKRDYYLRRLILVF